MRENKRKLKFKKIKIANMNTLRGGGETDTVDIQSDNCTPNEATDINNPCSETCLVTNRIGGTIVGDTSPVATGAGIGLCNYEAFELCKGH
jgi:hypothetical protein